MFQAIGIWGVTEPMTGPELIEWAKYHNMQYTDEHKLFSDFSVKRVDLEPLTGSQIAAFEACEWQLSNPGEATPEVAAEWGKTKAALHRSEAGRRSDRETDRKARRKTKRRTFG